MSIYKETAIYQEQMADLKLEEREKEGTRHNMTNTIAMFWSSRRIVNLLSYVLLYVQ